MQVLQHGTAQANMPIGHGIPQQRQLHSALFRIADAGDMVVEASPPAPHNQQQCTHAQQTTALDTVTARSGTAEKDHPLNISGHAQCLTPQRWHAIKPNRIREHRNC
jgi:hypothetical protein